MPNFIFQRCKKKRMVNALTIVACLMLAIFFMNNSSKNLLDVICHFTDKHFTLLEVKLLIIQSHESKNKIMRKDMVTVWFKV